MSNSENQINSTSYSNEDVPEGFQIIHRECVSTLFESESIDVGFSGGIGREDLIQS